MQKCSLCGDLSALQLAFEDDRLAVAVHEDWSVRGHVMVIWKTHLENVSDLDDDEWQRFSGAYRRVERAVLDLTQATRAIIMKLGIATPHLHLHIYPVHGAMNRRDVMDVIDAKARAPYDEAFVAELRARLRSALST